MSQPSIDGGNLDETLDAPAGLVMVPREPTEDMIQSAADGWGRSEGGLHNAFAAALRSGIAAAPAPADLIPPDALFVCGQMGANVTRVRAESAAPAVPLTDERIREIADECDEGQEPSEYMLAFARAVLSTAPAVPLTDELIDKLADRLWEQGHIQSLSKDTARIFARAVLSAAPAVREPLPVEAIRDAIDAAGLDWHNGWTVGDDSENRYLNLCRAIEQAHGIGGGNGN